MTDCQTKGELSHRYLIALPLLSGRDVLSIGNSCDAVDRAARSIFYLSKESGAPFPALDASIDIVLRLESLDTCICEEFVSEVKRVLRPNGLFLGASKCRESSLTFQFQNTCVLQQLSVQGSLLVHPAGIPQKGLEVFGADGEIQFVLKPTFVFLASDAALPPISSSIVSGSKIKDLEILAELAKAEVEYLRRKLKSKLLS